MSDSGPGSADMAAEVATASDWNARVAAVRRVPERFGQQDQAAVYAEIASRFYVPTIEPVFGFVHWRPEYELSAIEAAYKAAHDSTDGFMRVSVEDLAGAISAAPTALRIFRLIVGFTTAELAECTAIASDASAGVPKGAIEGIEGGRSPTPIQATLLARVIDACMSRTMFAAPQDAGSVRLKQEKPDTEQGWESIRHFAVGGVPLAVFLHQRAYGGAFRQLLDATSSSRGDELELPLKTLFDRSGVRYIRTGQSNQPEIRTRFGLTVQPAPDFVVFDQSGSLRAIFECKVANDGGTARDKAARFRNLRTECARLGGVPLFAVLGGVGWRRVRDALGPVVRETDGRVFTLRTLADVLTVDPFPSLIQK